MKRLVVYYSLSGNTKAAAENIAAKLGADIVAIETKKPMPESRTTQILVGGMQSTFSLSPEIKPVSVNFSDYEEIILGTPIWAGKHASPINTLAKIYGIKEHTVAVFSLDGGGENKNFTNTIKKLLPKVKKTVSLADKSMDAASQNTAKIDAFVKEILK